MMNSAAAAGAAAVPGALYPVQMQQPVYGNEQMAGYPAPGMEGPQTQELDGAKHVQLQELEGRAPS